MISTFELGHSFVIRHSGLVILPRRHRFPLVARYADAYRVALQNVAPSPETITELFRFALLLTGDETAAGELLVAAVSGMPEQVTQLRSEKPRTIWLLRKIRDEAGKRGGKAASEETVKAQEPAAVTSNAEGDPADLQAFNVLLHDLIGDESAAAVPPPPQSSSFLLPRFASLPEPERSTLAIFYLDILDLREQAQFFGTTIEELSERLGNARKLLQEACL